MPTKAWRIGMNERDPLLRELHAESLKRHWSRLDSDQRVIIKAEALRRAPQRLADDVRALPERRSTDEGAGYRRSR